MPQIWRSARRSSDLDVTQAMAFEALKADVRARWASRPPRGRTTGCRPTSSTSAKPEHAGEDEVRPGGDGRLHPGGCRGTSAEQERQDGGPGHQARRAGADGGRRELCGHDRPGQRVRHAGPGAACGSRAPDEAARGPQRHCRGGPGHPDAEEGPGHEGGAQWSDHFERAAGAYNARPHETAHGAPEDVEKQPATEFRVLQDNADKFQHNKDLTDRRVKAVEDAGAFRAPTNAARSFNPQYGDVQQLHDRPQHGAIAEAGAGGQRQRGGPADETGQAGGCEAAGRLPGASEAQDPRLAFEK